MKLSSCGGFDFVWGSYKRIRQRGSGCQERMWFLVGEEGEHGVRVGKTLNFE